MNDNKESDDHVDVEYVLWDSAGDFAFTITTVPNDYCVTIQVRGRDLEGSTTMLQTKPSSELVISGSKHARQIGELLIKAAKHLEETQ